MTTYPASVVITKKWPPKEGKTNWNLVDSAGVKYSTNPDLAALVQEGQQVMLQYEVKEFGGRPFNMTKNLTVTHGGTPMPAPPPPPQTYPVGYGSQPAPRPSNGPPVVDKDKMIFVTGIVGRAMGSGNFKPEEIHTLTEFACAAWTLVPDRG